MSTSRTNIQSTTPHHTLLTQEIDELTQYIKHADIELIQTGRSESTSHVTLISCENLDIQLGQYGASSICNAITDIDKIGIMYKSGGNYPTNCNGYDIERSVFALKAPTEYY